MDDDIDVLTAELIQFRRIEAFLIREAALLDDGRLGAWVDLFAEDGFYWAPADPSQQSPFERKSLLHEDRDGLRRRFCVDAPAAAIRSSRAVSNIAIEAANAKLGAYEISARFVMVQSRPGESQRFYAGRYDYGLLRSGDGGGSIAAKKATLLDATGIESPLAAPF